MNQTASVMIDGEISDPAVIGRGVRQGGLLSTILYNIYAEFMITEALENNSNGIKIGGELVAAVRYADDQAMMSYTNAGLQRIMDALNDAGKDYGMKINRKKTKLMRISKQPGKVVKLFIDGYQIEQVSSFCYLGSMTTEDGRSEKEIKCRIGMAKSKFYDNLKIFTGQLSTTTMIKLLAWSVALYAAEAWTMRKVDTQRFEAFEMWCWRKMFKISYKEHVTNDEVLSSAPSLPE